MPLSQPLFSLTLGELIGIILGGGAFLLAVVKIVWDWAHGRIRNPDTAITARVQASQSDREWVEKMERAHTLAGERTQQALDATIKVLETIAPLTRVSFDDAVLNLLRDIQTPGTPVPVPVVATPSMGGDAAASDAGEAG